MLKPTFDAQDFQKNRLFGSLGFFLFFIPLIACPRSRFGGYCANQGLLLFIVSVIALVVLGLLNTALGWLPLLGWALRLLRVVARVAVGCAVCFFTINAYLGRVRPLPIIGDIQLLR